MLVDENNFLVGWWTWKNCHKHIWCFVSKISETSLNYKISKMQNFCKIMKRFTIWKLKLLIAVMMIYLAH